MLQVISAVDSSYVQEPEPPPGKKFPELELPQNRTAPRPWIEEMTSTTSVPFCVPWRGQTMCCYKCKWSHLPVTGEVNLLVHWLLWSNCFFFWGGGALSFILSRFRFWLFTISAFARKNRECPPMWVRGATLILMDVDYNLLHRNFNCFTNLVLSDIFPSLEFHWKKGKCRSCFVDAFTLLHTKKITLKVF